MILDATCSQYRKWPSHADVRMDILLSVRPDIVADACHLPFKDGCFSEIYCDPPHMVAFDGDVSWKQDWDSRLPTSFRRFSYWKNRVEWRRFLMASGREFYRVLIPSGKLHYKVPDGSRSHGRMIDVTEVRQLTGFIVLRDETVQGNSIISRVNQKRGCRATMVHYVTLMKR